jgi:cytochrome c5
MGRFFKWVGITLGGLVLLIAVLLLVVYGMSQRRLDRIYPVTEEKVTVPTDPASIEQGRHIFQFRGCQACHSAWSSVDAPGIGGPGTHTGLPSQDIPTMEGHIYLDDPAVGRVVASNLTSGKGGAAGNYATDADWVRAIRHGIRPDGKAMLFMPSTEFYYLSDEDLGAVIAFIKSVEPVDNELPASEISFTGRIVMTLVKDITFIPAELIPHNAPRPAAPEPGITPEYGEYLTYSCKVCHGLTMSGGPIPGFPSSWPAAPNLTFGYGSALPNWTESGFMETLRTGKTPEGRAIRGEYMPWRSYRFMTDDELRAVWVYLGSLPKKDFGNR